MSDSTARLDDLRRRVREFNALSKKEQRAKNREASQKLDALLEKLEVEKVCLMILQRLELEADKGIHYMEVMRFPATDLKRGWTGGLFMDVPFEAVKDPVVYKVYMKLLRLGLRPLLVYEPHGSRPSPLNEETVVLQVKWGE